MRKILVSITILTLVFGLSACGTRKDETQKKDPIKQEISNNINNQTTMKGEQNKAPECTRSVDNSLVKAPTQADADAIKGQDKIVTMETSLGTMKIKLYTDKAPMTAANFVNLANLGYYDCLTFHRVISGFMIQGGDPRGNGTGGPGYKFADELPQNGEYKLGSLAMANSGPNTNGSQFFIVTGNAGVGLPPLYSLFGEVTEGMEVAHAIENVAKGPSDKPLEDVVMLKVTVE